MAQHEVDVELPEFDLGRVDAVFSVKADGTTIGAQHVSRGALVWFPAGNTYGHRMEWSAFAQMMVEEGEKSERR